jgi:hypothetical protein
MEKYYVAQLRGGGWFSRSSQFDSRLDEAKEMTWGEAIKMCKLYKSNGVPCVPVMKSDMEAVNEPS